MRHHDLRDRPKLLLLRTKGRENAGLVCCGELEVLVVEVELGELCLVVHAGQVLFRERWWVRDGSGGRRYE